ncbi:MAG: stage 0 sporulation protein, partial [Clostridia bacterium]|nr:stage 0 sporulation protein [Clostridia bacterium]
MANVVGVRFKDVGKVYYFDPVGLDFQIGEKVIVETVRGVECGEIAIEPKEVGDDEIIKPLKKIIRKATKEDVAKLEENRKKEAEALRICEQKIAKHNLDMKLVDVDYTLDGSKILFYFTADGRVDFRELVKDLAGVFHTRIELRQIGVRDEAKMLGGLGMCGRPFCCSSYMGDFQP